MGSEPGRTTSLGSSDLEPTVDHHTLRAKAMERETVTFVNPTALPNRVQDYWFF